MGHELNDARSLEYHRVIAERLQQSERALKLAQATLQKWRQDARVAAYYTERWQALLALPTLQLASFLVSPSEEANALRQVSPFAGVLDPRERWAIWRQTRAVGHSHDAHTA